MHNHLQQSNIGGAIFRRAIGGPNNTAPYPTPFPSANGAFSYRPGHTAHEMALQHHSPSKTWSYIWDRRNLLHRDCL